VCVANTSHVNDARYAQNPPISIVRVPTRSASQPVSMSRRRPPSCPSPSPTER
jgi:hypothetical protein